ncbi:MAG: hypothetical protein EAZ43_11255 [Betaproteobacteria bacterium]|nr:MAG: hypothetical protein EAZ43_11255 [Betaproteobacteria bacterium]
MTTLNLKEFQAHAESIPFLLNGTLPAAEAESLKAAISAEPALGRELELQRRIREAVNQSAAVPMRSTLPQFMNRLSAESQRTVNDASNNVTSLQRKVAPMSVAKQQRLGWKVAFALAASLVVIQAAYLVPLMQQTGGTLQPLSGASSSVAAAPNLQMTFRADATERQIREVLRAAGVEIVAGPSALGVYEGRAADSAAAAAALTAAKAVVEGVNVVPAKP